MTMKMSAPQIVSPRRFRNIVALVTLLLAPVVGVQGARPPHRAHLSLDLLRHEARRSASQERVILRGSVDEINAIVERHGLRVVKWLSDSAVVRANSRELSDLAGDTAVDTLSGDPIVFTGMSVSNTTIGADQTHDGTPGLLGIGRIAGVTGQGIGVAVIDSGITAHPALAKKIVANVSFATGDRDVTDGFGHGTHVAGIIAGAPTTVTKLYDGGVAPGVQLINVRVLGDNGTGYTSDVIAGIDWAVANRFRYNIRIINLSLGHPVTEPSATDPLCQAVQRAANAGMIVVVAAGNEGRSDSGARVLGAVTSPGNSPYAITVGATNTWGTVYRSDDTIADYSSRGPTRFDFGVKPDLAAPGNKIVSVEAAYSQLPTRYPYLHRAGTASNGYMQLSGTSMAAPMVSGAVALLLQGVPGLSAQQVKLALQSGATFIPDGGLMGGGAGSINVWASRKVTTNGLSSLLTSLTGSLLGGVLTVPSGASFWDTGSLAANLYEGSGIRLLSALDLSKIWSNPAGLRFGELNLAGLFNPLQFKSPNSMMYGGLTRGMADDGDEIIWGSQIRDEQGREVVWGSADDGDEIIWGSSDISTAPDPQ